jgi:hypothetical protein
MSYLFPECHRQHKNVLQLCLQVKSLQKRLAQTVAENSSQAYVGIKAMHEKFKEDQASML